MIDIIHLLRYAATMSKGELYALMNVNLVLIDAADEIEKLRTALREIERVRRTTQEGTFRKQHDPAWKIARAALGMTGAVTKE